jgi:L-ribulokinase
MWNTRWGGYPPNTYFKALDPVLDGLIDTFDARAYPCHEAAGTLSAKWADLFGLSEEVVVATGSLDCHAGAVGAGVRAKSMVEIIGTSTCAITVSPGDGEIREVPGVPQQAMDMILPG